MASIMKALVMKRRASRVNSVVLVPWLSSLSSRVVEAATIVFRGSSLVGDVSVLFEMILVELVVIFGSDSS